MESKIKSAKLLHYAGVLTLALAVFQAVISTVPSWALYFGAGEDVTSKIWLLYLSGFFVAIVFVIFALYAFSAAGKYRYLPFLKTVLITISIIFLLRGFFVIPEVLSNAGVIETGQYYPIQAVISSGVSLYFGMLYLVGTIKSWKYIPQKG
jgi:hypothetical protein